MLMLQELPIRLRRELAVVKWLLVRRLIRMNKHLVGKANDTQYSI